MGRTRIAKALARNLAEKRENSQKRKHELEKYLLKLKENYEAGKISYSRYVEIFHKKNEGKNLAEWIQYYDRYGKECEKEEKKYKRKIIKNKILTTFFAIALISFLIYFFSFANLSFTGLTIGENQKEFTQNINLNLTNSTEYEWQLENFGQLNSIKLNGLIEELNENSEVKIYLDDLLILDSSNLKESNKKTFSPGITGGVIEEETINNPIENAISESPQENTNQEEINQKNSYSEKEQDVLSDKNLQEAPLNEDSSPSQEEPLAEENTSKEEFSYTELNESNFKEQIKSDENKTEVQDDLNQSSNETETFQEETNETEIIQKETNETETFGPALQIKNESQTPTKIEEEINLPEEIKITVKEFKKQCEETCNLEKLNLTKKSYILRIEISNAKLQLDSITYEIFAEKIIPFKTNKTILSDENLTVITEQYPAILGQPVKWKKQITLKEQGIASVELPKEAENITINKITSSKAYSEQEAPSQEESSPSQEELLTENQKIKERAKFSITGNVISEKNTEKKSFKNFFKKIFSSITGRAVDIEKQEEKIKVLIEDNSIEYEIEYETPAPYSTEEDLPNKKIVKVVGPEEIHYENVLIFTNLSESLNAKSLSEVKIHWVEENTYITPTKIEDKDSNGIYDYVEFIAPHLSNQTFEIIIITKAQHLDSNRNFISDIYEQVNTLDNIWSETITDRDYVRVTFQIPLDKTRDITIYPRIISENPTIEVYEKDGTEKIAEFSSLIPGEYNKVYLTNLVGKQDTFDLKIVGGSVEFDYIVDPSTIQYLGSDTVQSSSTGGSSTVTIPSGATFCVIGISYWEAYGDRTLSMTLDGETATLINMGEYSATHNLAQLWYVKDFDSGDKFFNWTWSGAISEGAEFMFLFFNNVNLTNPIRDNDSYFTTSTANWYTTPNFDSSDSDMIVGVATSYETTINMTTATQTERITPGVYNNAQYAMATKPGTSSVENMTAYLAQGGLIGASLRALPPLQILNISYPTTSNTVNVSSYDNISIYFNYSSGGSNITSGVSLDSVFIGGVNASIKGSETVTKIFHLRTNDNGAADYNETVSFTGMPNTSYVALANQLPNADVAYSMKFLSKGVTSTQWWIQNDAGGELATQFIWGVFGVGHYIFGNNHIDCGIDTDTASTNAVTFAGQFPDAMYTAICNPGTDVDSPICVINSGVSKATTGLSFYLSDDGGTAETTTGGINYCAFSYGEYDVGEASIKASNMSVTNGVVSVSFDSAFSDTNYVVFITEISATSDDGCAYLITGRTTGGFTAIGYDDGNSSTSCDQQINWVAIEKGEFNVSMTSLTREFAYITNKGWQVNVTVPDFESGLKDLFINASYSGNTANETQANAINYGGEDTTPPTYNSVSINTTKAGQLANFAINVDDDFTLHPNGMYIFSTNNTGVWVNDSAINFTSTPEWANVTKTLNSTSDTFIGYRWYFNDSAGNPNSTEIYTLTTTEIKLRIITPNTGSPLSVSPGDNITIYFNFSDGETNITSGVSIDSVFIGGVNATIVSGGSAGSSYFQGFESVTFPPTGWKTGGNGSIVWVRDQTAGYTVNGSADTAAIQPNDISKTWLNYTYNFESNGYVEFWWNVSCENSGDFLCFCEDKECGDAGCRCVDFGGDGNPANGAGEADESITSSGASGAWTSEFVNYSVEAGTHSFTWCYAKDFAGYYGADAGLLDNVTFASLSSQTTEFAYIENIGWQVNVTVPDGFSGLQDLFVNATYSGSTVNDTQTNAINYGGGADNPPEIIYVYNSTEMTDISSGPNEGPFATYVQLNFTAYDEQGFDDLNDSSVQVNFSLAGEESRLNTRCTLLEDYDTYYANYTCNVTMWWWDAPGTWAINASIEDNNGNNAFNDSTTFSVGSTTGFLANSTELNWPEISPGASNQEANEFLLLNNTGNTQVSVEINATDLVGENNPLYALGANNFSAHTSSGCEGTAMSNYEYTTVIGATIAKGNYSLDDGTAQEAIYFCLEISNSDLISQPYSTKQKGSWTIRVFLAAFVVRRRKKNKKIQDDKLLKAINLIADELKEEYSLNKKEVIEIIIERLKKKYDLTRNEFLGIIKAREGTTIPITVFTKELGALESLT
ncbi:MAG TPA: hypothetical protein PK357_00740, partial [Candidatus Pacearchaeota archaeon]|nr:hypothetical protein [Candidatus Pacearchaeota archaeon]